MVGKGVPTELPEGRVEMVCTGLPTKLRNQSRALGRGVEAVGTGLLLEPMDCAKAVGKGLLRELLLEGLVESVCAGPAKERTQGSRLSQY